MERNLEKELHFALMKLAEKEQVEITLRALLDDAMAKIEDLTKDDVEGE